MSKTRKNKKNRKRKKHTYSRCIGGRPMTAPEMREEQKRKDEQEDAQIFLDEIGEPDTEK